jgi:hypothetical protein
MRIANIGVYVLFSFEELLQLVDDIVLIMRY